MGHHETPNRYVQLHRDLRQASIRVPYASTLIDARAHVGQSVSDLWAVASWILTTSSDPLESVSHVRSVRRWRYPERAWESETWNTVWGVRFVGYNGT